MTSFESRRSLGVFQILLSGFCFGFLGVFGKSAFSLGISPGELLSLRFLLAGTLLFLYLLIFAKPKLRMKRVQVAWSCALGALGYAVFSFFYFQALHGLSVSLTVLLLYTYPVFVAIGGWIFLNERIAKERWFVIPAALIGMVLLIWGEFYVKDPWSLALGISAAAFYAVYILCSRKFLEGVDPLASVAYMQVSAGSLLAILNWRDPARIFEVVRIAWAPLIGLAIICSIGAMSLFLAGLQKLKSWEASILSTAEPVTSILIAFCLLGERLSFTQVCGACLVFIAFIFVSIPPRGSLLEKSDVD